MVANLTVYKTRCDLCPSAFNTTTALMRHRSSKHCTDAEPITSLLFYSGQEVLRLPPTIRTGLSSSSYKQWVTGIVDSMNSWIHEFQKPLVCILNLFFVTCSNSCQKMCPHTFVEWKSLSHCQTFAFNINYIKCYCYQSNLSGKLEKNHSTSPLISRRCGRMNGRMRDKRLNQSPCKFKWRQFNVTYTTIDF